jgi:hypothetical protein
MTQEATGLDLIILEVVLDVKMAVAIFVSLSKTTNKWFLSKITEFFTSVYVFQRKFLIVNKITQPRLYKIFISPLMSGISYYELTQPFGRIGRKWPPAQLVADQLGGKTARNFQLTATHKNTFVHWASIFKTYLLFTKFQKSTNCLKCIVILHQIK